MELNESSFAPADPASYTLEEFWPPGGIGDHLAIARVSSSEQRTMTGVLTDSLGNLDEDSTVTHQSISCRKKRDSSIISPNTCGAQEKCNSSSKRAKVLDIKEVKRILKDEADDTCDTNGKKMAEASKQDFIHVRARRGQATDSHSLAERARREKISERMKVLQDLVPGCNKVIGKALVLDEIINYVLSLQHQVEFLSLKLEAINSNILPKEKMLPAKNLEMPGFDSAGMIFHTHPTSDYARGLQSKSLRMHMGENLE